MALWYFAKVGVFADAYELGFSNGVLGDYTERHSRKPANRSFKTGSSVG